jgi:hypothetical protein
VADSASGSRSDSVDGGTACGGGGGGDETKNVLALTTTSSFVNSLLITDDSEGERAGVEGRCCRSTRIAAVRYPEPNPKNKELAHQYEC